MEKIKVGQIGCGNWGKNIARNLVDLNVLHKIWDVDVKSLRLRNINDSLITDNVSEIFNDKMIDCVVISSPASTHKEFAIKAISKNKHVFIEKPFCLSLKDAKTIIRAAKKHNKIIFVGHLLHYHNAFIELKKQLASGSIGNINIIKANRLNFGLIRSTESVIYDLVCHDVSMILSIMQEMPRDIQVNSIFKNSSNLPDIVNIILKFSKNVFAKINADWISPYKEHRFSVLGTNGSMVFDDNKKWGEKLCLNPSYISKGLKIIYKKEKFIKLKEEEPLKKELESFLDCITYNKQPITNHLEALNVQKVLESIDKKLSYFKD